MTLKRALLYLIVLVLGVGTLPAGMVAYGQLKRALRLQVRESLLMAPELLVSRWAATVDVRMMHARDVARTPGLAGALAAGDTVEARRMVEQAGAAFPEAPLLVDSAGRALLPGAPIRPELLDATRAGRMPVEVVRDDRGLWVLSLAPVEQDGRWTGAAGGVSPLNDEEAAALAGLTRSEVVILDPSGRPVGASLDPERARALAGELSRLLLAEENGTSSIRDARLGSTDYLLLSVPLGAEARVVFLKDLSRELSVLPLLRRIALWSAGITLVLAFLLGTLFAARLARPVGSLAEAATRLETGDFEAPIEPSGIREVAQVARAFDRMRSALRARVEDLEAANRELADRQERLVVLQGELVQRDRLASAGRLLSQLAHEIRNPIASIRNCLEVLRRQTPEDSDAREFADLAIDELLRMHELTERMLDVHRPRAQEAAVCCVNEVAEEVASLLRAGVEPGKRLAVSIASSEEVRAGIDAGSLKQVLLNLGLNAREAMEGEGLIEFVISSREGEVQIDVLDRGPGIPEEIRERIFDPFFTTKKQVRGVGLGLFTVEATLRTFGGRIRASARDDGPGARFTLQLPPPARHG